MRVAKLLLGAVVAMVCAGQAHAALIYGSLSNFDCINDTGQTAYGFEIELDGVATTDVFATFGSPYNRYGNPTITSLGANTFVRWESTYLNGAWSVGTASGTYGPTGGHALFFPAWGGDPLYPNVPGDHFGVALGVTPTNTIYHWLHDGGNGTLVYANSAVKIPAPVLALAPPANPANPVAVQAVVPAPAPEVEGQAGDAIWVKVITTVMNNPGVVELHDLVQGNAVVPPETETEVEWQLLQTGPNGALLEQIDQADVPEASQSVVRRYEFFTYLGQYDPESHEALDEAYDASLVGDFLGNQNVAVNLAPAVPEPSTFLIGGVGAMGLWFLGCRRRATA